MRRTEILNKIIAIICKIAGIDNSIISNNTTFSEIGLKNKDILIIIFEIKKQFGIIIEYDNSDKFCNIPNVMQFVCEITECLLDVADIKLPGMVESDDASHETESEQQTDTTLNTIEKVEAYLFNLTGAIDKILISDAKEKNIVDIKDIIKLDADGCYTIFYWVGGNKKEVSKNLGSFSYLQEFFKYWKVHKSHVINPIHIKGFDEKNDTIKLSEGLTAKVSGSHLKEVRAFLKALDKKLSKPDPEKESKFTPKNGFV